MKYESPHLDARYVQWSELFRARDRTGLIASLEADLRSDQPHSEAPQLLGRMKEIDGKLENTWANALDPATKKRLGPFPQLYITFRDKQYARMLLTHPPDQAPEQPAALHLLADAADYLQDSSRQFDYLSRLLLSQPTDSHALIELANLALSHQHLYEDFLTLCENLDPGPSADFLNGLLRFRLEWSFHSVHPYVRQWLAAHPEDGYMWGVSANLLRRLEHFAEADGDYEKSLELSPFHYQAESHAYSAIEQRQYGRARTILERHKRLWLADLERLEVETEIEFAQALREVGDKGRALEVLRTALSQYPEDAKLLFEQAQLESKMDHADTALRYVRQALERKSDQRDWQAFEIRMLIHLKEKDRAIEGMRRYMADADFKSIDDYLLVWDVYETFGTGEERLSIGREVVEAFPQSPSAFNILAMALGEDGKMDEAIDLLDQALHMIPSREWVVDKMLHWVEAYTTDPSAHPPKEGTLLAELQSRIASNQSLQQALVQNYKTRYPWISLYWRKEASFMDQDDIKPLIEFWQQAVEANPNRCWPYHELLFIYRKKNRMEEATIWANQAIQAVSSEGEAEIADAHWELGLVYDLRLENDDLTSDEVQQTLQIWDRYRSLGGYENQYYHYRASLLAALGQADEAKQSRRKAASIRPNVSDYIWSLVTLDGDGYAFARANDYLMYDPENPERLANLIEMHIKWNGSPIVALKHFETLRRVDPKTAEWHSFTEGMGWQQLGDAVKAYELRYQHINGLHTSDRYISWYKNNREGAQQPRNRVDVDPQLYRATIYFPNGETGVREDHPVFGQPMLLQRGTCWLRGTYDEHTGDLIEVESSSGAVLKAGYLPNGKLQSLSSGEDHNLTLTYDGAGRIQRINLSGVGELRIMYDQNGESRVESDDEDVANRIRLTLGMQSQWLSAMHQHRSDLVFSEYGEDYDEERQRRWQAVESLEQGNAASAIPIPEINSVEKPPSEIMMIPSMEEGQALSIATAKAKVSLARHLGRNLEKSHGYAEEARELLQEVFETALANRGLQPLADLGVESIALWHLTILKEKRRELTRDLYARWNHMREWLDRVVDKQANDVLLLDLIRRIEEHPLPLLKEDAFWLDRLPISNPHLWRTFSMSDLLIHQKTEAEIQCLLIRKNGDVVVGCTHGLCIREGQTWTTHGIDSESTRLQPFHEGGIPLSVMRVTEDYEGVLWIATDQGVFAQKPDGYLRWPSLMIESSQTTQMAALRSGVLIATSSGLKRVTWEEEPKTLISEPLRFLRPITVPRRSEFNKMDGLTASDWETSDTPSEFDPAALIATHDHIYAYLNEELKPLMKITAADGTYVPDDGKLYFLRQNRILETEWDGFSSPERLRPVPDQHMITATHEIETLAVLQLGQQRILTGMHTEGLALYAHDSWQNWRPGEDLPAPISGLACTDRCVAVYGRQAISLFEQCSMIQDNSVSVIDTIIFPELGYIPVVRENRIDLVKIGSKDSPPSLEVFTYWSNTQHIARDHQGRLIANQGLDIVRYESLDDPESQTFLFSADMTPPSRGTHNYEPGSVSSIVVDGKDMIWVTCGASVFCWREGDSKPREFSIFLDPEIFPARSDMISRVVKTFDGKIWVIASDENHRKYLGVPMVGGILEWNGRSFDRIPIPDSIEHQWFITGYTKISEKLAVCGTSNGFLKHSNRGLEHFGNLPNDSYKALFERTPLLWCGTQGAALSNGSWLFGCAGGVVRYDPASDQWTYPEKINHCLPDHHLREYGSMAVDAIVVDNNNWVYVGTHRGFLMFAWETE